MNINTRLLEEVDYLREQVRQYKDALGCGLHWPPDWRLTPSERVVLGVLVTREVATKEAILITLYGDRADPPAEGTIRHFVCTLRKKLAPVVTIHTAPNTGWRLVRADRARLREIAAAHEDTGRESS
jgi:two-component system, cell cycle response regulator CtrA